VPSFSIYTDTASEFTTDQNFLVRALAIPPGYEIVGVYYADQNGDGTVPEYSARGHTFYVPLPVVNCKHSLMCETDAVLDSITNAIPSVRVEKA
jgi:hypothetical protein